VPQNYDVKVGDVLVTSGLDGVFPFGLPVARITRVERDPTQPLAQIYASPLARIEADREVLFIWSRPGHPAAPASPETMTVEEPKPAAPVKPAPKPARKPAPQETPPAVTPGTEATPAPAPAPVPSPDNGAAPPPAEVPST